MSPVARRLLPTIALGALIACVILLPLIAQSREPREIVLVAKQMSFIGQGGTVRNPTILVNPGERIRLTLVNEDPGVGHDFVVRAWSVSTPLLQGLGTTSVVFRAPDTAGSVDYACSKHLSMMTGTIDVVAPGS